MTLRKINTADKDFSLIQDNVDSALTPLQAIPMVGGNVITSVLLTSGVDNPVSHGLGRLAQYFILMNQNANATVWQTSITTTVINLRCSAACTVTIWVN